MVINWKSRCGETKAQRFEVAAGAGGPRAPELGSQAGQHHPLPCATPGSSTGGLPWLPYLLALKFVHE